jgi:hypothetical protein
MYVHIIYRYVYVLSTTRTQDIYGTIYLSWICGGIALIQSRHTNEFVYKVPYGNALGLIVFARDVYYVKISTNNNFITRRTW